jgi:hypothetical protein
MPRSISRGRVAVPVACSVLLLAGVAAVAAVATIAAPAAATTTAIRQSESDAGPARQLDDAIALLEELDRRRITVAYDDQPLLRIINELEVVHGVPLTADWTSLDRFGVDARTTITLRAEDTPVMAVLDQLAVLVGDDFERATIESFGGRILLTTDAIAARVLVPAVYDVRDLVAAEAARLDRRGLAGGAGPADDAAGDSEDPGNDADADAAADGADAAATLRDPGPGERLLRLALEHAAPETWLRFGGNSARVTERDGVLLVSAPATTHRTLRTVLAALRQADPRGMVLDATIVRVPAGTWDQLDRRYDPSQSAFARRLLGDAAAVAHWRSRSSVAMGERMQITEVLADGHRVRLSLAPRLSAEDGVVRLTVRLEYGTADVAGGGAAGPAGTLETVVPIATVGGAASIGIPGDDGEGELVLVVLPRRY